MPVPRARPERTAKQPPADRRRTPPGARRAAAGAGWLRLQRDAGNRVAARISQRGARAIQTGRGGKKEGTFIGDESKIHLHIDIGNPHLMVLGDRYDIKGGDWNGYSYSRCAQALDGLTSVDRRGVSGAVTCRNWLEDVLDGETIPTDPPGTSINGSSWGQGLIKSYPAKPFEKGQ